MAKRAFIIPHTHWDREWYQPFQEFRLRLVQLVDRLLDIMAADPEYCFFMLDGQTVVLEDYLAIRPHREGEIRGLVQDGRLLIGPWFLLPDEFLVSPESLVRNLVLGDRVARRFGGKMQVGYVPDQFGHISQLPQVLRGFELSTAVLWRGLDDQPIELRWRSPDGGEVLAVYLRGGYGNAVHLPVSEPEQFAQAVKALADELGAQSATGCLPLMNGSDHVEPRAALPAAIAHAADALVPLAVEFGTLPRYIEAVRDVLGEDSLSRLPLVEGELRSPKVQHLLPGVLSARIWIKQRNAHVQTLLERWAEPWSALAEWASARTGKAVVPLSPAREALWQAWRYLLENQPHDSICGCSVDQVHREMATRFDWAEQMGEEIVRQSLAGLASQIDTASAGAASAFIVFNPLDRLRTDLVEVGLDLPGDPSEFLLVDGDGTTVPYQVQAREQNAIFDMTLSRDEFSAMMDTVREGRVLGKGIRAAGVSKEGNRLRVDVTLSDEGAVAGTELDAWRAEVQSLLADESVQEVEIEAREEVGATVTLVAEDVPPLGYKTYWLRPGSMSTLTPRVAASGLRIENEFLAVQVNPRDGTLSLLHKPTGMVLEGVNRLVDQGDRGDEYNYCPPEQDLTVDAPFSTPSIRVIESGPARATLEVELLYRLPESLDESREGRSEHLTAVPITTRISVAAGVPRCDIETTVVNTARDHRLRVHVPTPIVTDHSWAEGSYDVVRRSLSLPANTEGWSEQPQPTFPQRSFCDVNDGERGILLAVRGLPEAEVIPGRDGVTIALTLLRCVGWLSRDDLSVRHGHAGPAIPTPDAQEFGEHTFHYSVIPHAGGWAEAMAQAHAFEAPLRAVATGFHEATLPGQASLVRVEPSPLVVTAVKPAEDEDGIIMRACNYGDIAVDAQITTLWPLESAELVTLAEKPTGTLQVSNGNEVRVPCGAWEVVSVRLRPAGSVSG